MKPEAPVTKHFMGKDNHETDPGNTDLAAAPNLVSGTQLASLSP
jgi:hypothetical protein